MRRFCILSYVTEVIFFTDKGLIRYFTFAMKDTNRLRNERNTFFLPFEIVL